MKNVHTVAESEVLDTTNVIWRIVAQERTYFSLWHRFRRRNYNRSCRLWSYIKVLPHVCDSSKWTTTIHQNLWNERKGIQKWANARWALCMDIILIFPQEKKVMYICIFIVLGSSDPNLLLEGSSRWLESAATEAIWKRSVEYNNMRYATMLPDDDANNKTYIHLTDL